MDCQKVKQCNILNTNTGEYSTNLSIKHSQNTTTLNCNDTLVKTYMRRSWIVF